MKKSIENKSMHWWTKEITVMRKNINAVRRQYQRTKHDSNLREAGNNTRRRKGNTKQHSRRQRWIHGSNIATLLRRQILGTLFINWQLVILKAAAHSKPYESLTQRLL